MKTGRTIQFKNWKCNIHIEKYSTGSTALILKNAEIIDDDGYIAQPDEDTIAIASVNILGANLPINEIAIKDYSENEGMLAALIKGNIIHMPHKYIKSGFVEYPVAKLKIEIG